MNNVVHLPGSEIIVTYRVPEVTDFVAVNSWKVGRGEVFQQYLALKCMLTLEGVPTNPMDKGRIELFINNWPPHHTVYYTQEVMKALLVELGFWYHF